MLSLYNTLSRSKEQLTGSSDQPITLYACGPTVYDYAHIGHFRAYIFVDVLRRTIRAAGLELKHVMNITDVGHLTDDADAGEDKMERQAGAQQKTVWEVAKFYTDDFNAAMAALNVETPDIVCKATDHIPEMIDLAKKIEANGYAYRIADGLYFDTAKLSDYGKLARLNVEDLRAGARVEVNADKRHPTDFALWKLTPPGVKRQMEWDSAWGRGFPGWHIECTAMAVKYLGEQIDIHTGGIDHIPVHHTNEIAQAQGAFGHDIVRIWCHNEFLLVDGEKMSKSKKNFYTMRDIIDRGIDPLAVRYFFLLAHYRTPVNFTWNGLSSAQNSLENLRSKIKDKKLKIKNTNKKLKIDDNVYYKNFMNAINDDLNTAAGLAVMWEMLKDESVSDEEKLALALEFDQVLGLCLADVSADAPVQIPPVVQALLAERHAARERKNFSRSDELRDQILGAGFEVLDTAEGQTVKGV